MAHGGGSRRETPPMLWNPGDETASGDAGAAVNGRRKTGTFADDNKRNVAPTEWVGAGRPGLAHSG
jgi:hypothetical protein